MPTDVERRRVLVAARASEESALRELFASAALARWEPLLADSFPRARFLLQHTACDLLLVDEGLYHTEGSDGLAWLAAQGQLPTLLLAGPEQDTLRRAYESGANVCLPRQLTLENPALLSAALRRALRSVDAVRTHRRTRETLHQCRRQVDRLVGLLWRAVPLDVENHWCSQRHILVRLQEEIARSTRHGEPLTVAVGEVIEDRGEPVSDLGGWVADLVARTKRRCDVAGQYGLAGFLLLMVHTSAAGGAACCERLRQALEQGSVPGNPCRPVRACFGMATLSPETSTSQALLGAAEQRLEAARAAVGMALVAAPAL